MLSDQCYNLILMLILVLLIFQCFGCHYSCQQCTAESYFSCTLCRDNLPVQSFYCDSPVPTTVISLGTFPISKVHSFQQRYIHPKAGTILLLLFTTTVVLLRSKLIIYGVLALQTLSLASLIETNWGSPTQTFLQICRYLMIFNTITVKSPSPLLLDSHMIKLHSYMSTPFLLSNYLPLFTLYLVCTLTTITLLLLNRLLLTPFPLSTPILLSIKTFMVLTMQEAILTVSVAARYSTLSSTQTTIIIVTAIIILAFATYSYFQPLPYFSSSASQFIILSIRSAAPALVILPAQYQYTLLLIMPLYVCIHALFLYLHYATHPKHIGVNTHSTITTQQTKQSVLLSIQPQAQQETRKNQTNTKEDDSQEQEENAAEIQKMNKYHYIRIGVLFALQFTAWCMLGVSYILEINSNQEKSRNKGVVVVILLVLILFAYICLIAVLAIRKIIARSSKQSMPFLYQSDNYLDSYSIVANTLNMEMKNQDTASVEVQATQQEQVVIPKEEVVFHSEKAYAQQDHQIPKEQIQEDTNLYLEQDIQPYVRRRRKIKDGQPLIETRKAYQVLKVMNKRVKPKIEQFD